MSITTKLTTLLTAACLLLIMVISNSAYALSLPGINPSGSPAFLNSVKVTLRNNSIIVRKNSNDFFLGDPSLGIVNGTNGKYLLNGDWDNSGNFLGGTVSLTGRLPSIGITSSTLLYSAILPSGNSNVNWSPFLIGFNTSNIACHEDLEAIIGSCTTAESVYLEIDDEFDGDFTRNGNDQFRTTGAATTTIPLPAAVWLFGSGLLGLVGVARRNRAQTV